MNKQLKDILNNVEKVIIGKTEVIELALCSLLCGGHVLIEDMPGVGKTSLVFAIAKSFDASFNRIQFTPDILPSDITGFSIYNQKTGEFDYHKGSIMSQIILADEINRTSPKTQSSLLEVMEENQVTVDGTTYEVPQPFTVFATQNPIEYLGTYPLPEAQLDRFFMKISMGYPNPEHEMQMLELFGKSNPLKEISPVVNTEELIEMKKAVSKIHVNSAINEYIIKLVNQTRNSPYIVLGASPRASICLYKAAQAIAYMQDRDFIIPDDIKKIAKSVLSHRIVPKQEIKLQKLTTEDLIENILKEVKAPL
jgi:MoxR-like ATPase